MKKKMGIFLGFAGTIALFYALFPTNEVETVFLFTSYSFLRMLAAYMLSLVFAVIYGLYAAKSKKNEKIMIPLLDILQSVPILGFFPIVMFLLIDILPTLIGVEIASIILIFTSQAWNMAFGVYEGIITIPQQLLDSAKAFALKRGLLFRALYFPAMIPKLIYNSMMSWSGGWYFLFAAEIISLGNVRYTLPGIGSYIWKEVSAGVWQLGLLGLGTLLLVIIAMDIIVWRPLSVIAAKYRYEETGEAIDFQKFYFIRFLSTLPKIRIIAEKFSFFAKKFTHFKVPAAKLFRYTKWFVIPVAIALLGLIIYGIISGYSVIVSDISHLRASQFAVVPVAIVLSSLRMLIAYGLSLLWIIPVVYYMSTHPHANRILTPVFEILASIPATALFPFMVLIFLRLPEGLNIISILLIMTGMQWYLLFNVLGGVRSFPSDLNLVAKSFRFKKSLYLKKVFLPGIYPSIITGSITGWGGGWNALIVSEYITVNGTIFWVMGLGSLIDIATYSQTNLLLNLIYLFFMIMTVLAFNRFLWKKLYKNVSKYKLE